MVLTSMPSNEARVDSWEAYGDSSPHSVRSMKVRTPARRRASSFGLKGFLGVHGYSHASNRGVAQYEFGIGRAQTAVSVRGLSMGGSAFNMAWSACMSPRSEESLHEIMVMMVKFDRLWLVFCVQSRL